MKQKRFLYSLAASLMSAAVATAGLTACDDIENPASAEQPAKAEVHTYTVSIPAIIGDDATTRAVEFDNTGATPAITTKFTTTDKIYVYNLTKGAILDGNLQPTNLSNNGKNCDLGGTLTGTIEAGDHLMLMCNPNNHYLSGKLYDYVVQDGTTPLDGATAEVVTSAFTGGVLTTTASASFKNAQAMFRLKFKDENGTPINVKWLEIESARISVSGFFFPCEPAGEQYVYVGGGTKIYLASATNDYLYVALCINEAIADGDVLIFTAHDNDDHIYMGTKAAPSGGFKNGKYYYNTAAITLTRQPDEAPVVYPTVTPSVTPNANNLFDVYHDAITISGTCNGCSFWINNDNATVTLSNCNATYTKADNYMFIYTNNNVTIILDGDNTISCPKLVQCIFVGKTLKLSGNGTLTVTSKDEMRCSLCGFENYNYGDSGNNNYTTTSEIDVTSQLSADPTKTTVIRSPRSGNETIGYTWMYTVTTTP